MIKQIVLLLAVLSIGTIMIQNVQGQTVQNTLTIIPDCGLGTITGASFDGVKADDFTLEKQIDIENEGTGDLSLKIFATHWLSGSDVIIFGNNTGFSDAPSTYAAKTQLNDTNNPSGIAFVDIESGVTNSTWWQVDTTLSPSVSSTWTGDILQTFTLISTCTAAP